MMFKIKAILGLAAASLLAPVLASASTVDGSVTLNFDKKVLAELQKPSNSYGLASINNNTNPPKDSIGKRAFYLEEAISNYTGPITNTTPDNPPGINPLANPTATFNVTGATVSGYHASRLIAPTTYSDSGVYPLNSTNNPTGGSGVIGLDGALRFRSDVLVTGGANGYGLMDGLTLEYSAAEVNRRGYGESGWALWTHTPSNGGTPQSAFELINVSATTIGGKLALSGDLIFAESDWSNWLGFSRQNTAGTDPSGFKVVGHLTLTPSAVPVPAAVWMFGSAMLGLVGIRRRKVLA